MKKIFILLALISFHFFVSAQSMEYKFSGKDRPEIERAFRAADNSHSLIYYTNGTVSFFNDSKYTDIYVVLNVTEPLRMIIVNADGTHGDTLHYNTQTQGYINKATGMEYKLIEKSINRKKTSK